MRKPSSRRRSVAIVVPYVNKAGREFFAGALRYSHVKGRWKIRVLESIEALTPKVVADLANSGTDGIITCGISSQETADALAQAGIPLVVEGEFGCRFFNKSFRPSCITIDECHIGESAAEYMIGLGLFRSVGVVPCRDEHLKMMSDARCRGFVKRMQQNRISPQTFAPNGDWTSSLEEWLLKLGLPAAVFTPIDRHGREILNACERIGLASPGQVCVLGAADDERYCLTSSPELSSVTTGSEQEGYAAAQELARLMRGGKRCKTRSIAKRTLNNIVKRESTAPVFPATTLIKGAIEYIQAHATEDICVQDVVDATAVSRRLLEIRFRQIYGMTINEAILRERLGNFCRRLIDSNDSISAVARSCGFANLPYLSTLFKRHYGSTILEWRQSGGLA